MEAPQGGSEKYKSNSSSFSYLTFKSRQYYYSMEWYMIGSSMGWTWRCNKFEYTSHIKQILYKVVICYCDYFPTLYNSFVITLNKSLSQMPWMMSFPEYMNKFIMGMYILALKLLHEVVTHLGCKSILYFGWPLKIFGIYGSSWS
jgi:hypothetical protein